MPEGMIERVARALCTERRRDPDRLEPGDDPRQNNTPLIDGRMPNGDSAHFAWREFENAARAVLSAMREPTEAMLGVTDTALLAAADDCNGLELAGAIWSAMIDAALEEK